MGKDREIRLTDAEIAQIQGVMALKQESFDRISVAFKKAINEKGLNPKTSWGKEDVTVPGVVWNAQFDNRFLVEVQRPNPKDLTEKNTDSYFGYLLLFDHQKEDSLIFSEVVHLAYGASFGPDFDDVNEWQEKIADFVDNKYQK